MAEISGSVPPPTEVQPSTRIERGNTSPEIIANAPLENTTFLYSVPVMGEWKNGNLLRMLKGMFSQKPKEKEAFEVELITNVGSGLRQLATRDKDWNLEKDEQGIILKTEPENEYQKEILDILDESRESVNFLRKVVEAQRLSRTINANPKDQALQGQLGELLDSVDDPLQKDVIQQAINKAGNISLAVIDATHTIFQAGPYYDETTYYEDGLSMLRTLGTDIARVRFARSPNIVLGMFDADSVPGENNAVRNIQQIFNQYPDLTYLFTGMANLPAGHSKDLLADAPREAVKMAWYYGKNYGHGSPQILFRLEAYDKLKEIGAWTDAGFSGDEDSDTAFRLIYHFGNLQDGLLLESSVNFYAPTILTADRLDGAVDSSFRNRSFLEKGVRYIGESLGGVFHFREMITNLISGEDPQRRTEILAALEKSRVHFERGQKVQQRMNRQVLYSLINAVDKGYIKLLDGTVDIAQADVLKLNGGNALLHYVETNKDLITEAMNSPADIAGIKYMLGISKEKPTQVPSQFLQAVREYIGETKPFDDLVSQGLITGRKLDDENAYPSWSGQDLRDGYLNTSVLHSSVAEILALSHIYRTFFENREFNKNHEEEQFRRNWPENPDEQEIHYTQGHFESRIKRIEEEWNVRGDEIPKPQRKGMRDKVLSSLSFRSIPLFELFKRLH